MDISSNSDNVNFFLMFGLPVSYKINETDLMKAYFEKQRQLHPDISDENSNVNDQLSADVNIAYKCLMNPVDRAEHFLALRGMQIQNDVFTDFADEMFEIRQKYASLENDESAKNDFIDFLKHRTAEITDKLYNLENDLQKFRSYTGLLRFITSFLEKVESNAYCRN